MKEKKIDRIIYRKLRNYDKEWVTNFIRYHWGSESVVVHKTIYYPAKLKGFIVEAKREKIGLVTFKILNSNCEIVTLNSTRENEGIATRLVNKVIAEAKKAKCKKVWLITTNDNIKAIYFYQKLGFQLVKVYPDAVAESRKLKSDIPRKGENGIPIRDELEFCLWLDARLN
jgi:N-acetylglutamate synthase-like GNAT family acetyltransferase